MHTRTNLRQIIHALSDALDLVGVDDIAHGKRVAVMLGHCATVLGLNAVERAHLFDLGLVHDVGVSSTATHQRLVTEFDWEQSAEHCRLGYELLKSFKPLRAMAEPILYHHTRWDLLCLMDIPATVRAQANLILLADRADALAAHWRTDTLPLTAVPGIREELQTHTGSYFAPELMRAFLEASRTEAFWLSQEEHSIPLSLHDQFRNGGSRTINLEEVRQLAHLFARIVDAKSPFTAEHSLGVARVARQLGVLMGLGYERCVGLEIAGLLHDLGKLRIPDEILNKPAGLNPDERAIINVHSYETYQILRRIEGFEDIAMWAACHHEEPDGSGYPFHMERAALPVESRIMRVADIFQAMVQDRPYRSGLPVEQVRAFMRSMARQNRIDQEVASVADEHIDVLLTLAT